MARKAHIRKGMMKSLSFNTDPIPNPVIDQKSNPLCPDIVLSGVPYIYN